MAVSRTDFASLASNGDCDKPRFASCTCSISTDGEDADMDRGEDDDDAAAGIDGPDALTILSFFFCDFEDSSLGIVG